MTRFRVLATLALLAACGPKDASAPPPAAPGTAETAVTPTGKVITVEMIADEKGSRYEPSEITAHTGDVLRFINKIGVHNVNFLPDSNPGAPNLPAPSEMFQLPDQTFDLTVSLPAGKRYYFQCDPHAALGMKGHLKVE